MRTIPQNSIFFNSYQTEYYNPTMPPSNNFYNIYMVIDTIDFTDLYQIKDDITDALYVTLSWVSCRLYAGIKFKYMN